MIDFFYDFGERDLYGPEFGSRAGYVRDKLLKFNGTEKMAKIVIAAFEYWDEAGFDCEAEASQFNRLLSKDGFRLIKEYGPGHMQGSRYVQGFPYFEVQSLATAVLTPGTLANLNHSSFAEQISKASNKISTGDFAGSITNAYTLVEAVLKQLLRETGAVFNEDEGDIRVLYATLKGPLNLDPKDPALDVHLKTILDGFQKIVAGLYNVANKGSDRHVRRYHPAVRHAKLAVNSAFALGEFLFDSLDAQRARLAPESQRPDV